MSTKSMVLKSSVFPEWYMDRIQPWLQYAASLLPLPCRSRGTNSYVPVKVDYSDLYDMCVFETSEGKQVAADQCDC